MAHGRHALDTHVVVRDQGDVRVADLELSSEDDLIDLEFNAPDAEQDLKLGVDLRRDLLLIFKEAVSNAARHSNCSRVVIDFSADGRRLSLRVTDNGIGFDTSSESAGHGLVSMRRRAAKLNGSFEVETANEKGTTVSVSVPLSHPTSLSR